MHRTRSQRRDDVTERLLTDSLTDYTHELPIYIYTNDAIQIDINDVRERVHLNVAKEQNNG